MTFSQKMKTPLFAIFVIMLSALSGVAQTDEVKPRKVDQKEYSLGETDARRDLKQGKIEYKVIGQPSMIDQDLKKIVLKDYGVTVKFQGCVRGPRIDYDQGYLDTVIAHLKKKHTFNPVLKVERQLRKKAENKSE